MPYREVEPFNMHWGANVDVADENAGATTTTPRQAPNSTGDQAQVPPQAPENVLKVDCSATSTTCHTDDALLHFLIFRHFFDFFDFFAHKTPNGKLAASSCISSDKLADV